jgi:hypothetical protein
VNPKAPANEESDERNRIARTANVLKVVW